MRKVIYTVFCIGMLGVVFIFLGKLSALGIWVVAGIFSLVVVLITIRAMNKKRTILMMFIIITTIAINLYTQSSSTAQTFEELKILCDENTSILQEAKAGQYGPIGITTDVGSAGEWVEIFAPQFHFSSYKEIVNGIQGTQAISPTVLVGKVSDNLYVVLIRTFTSGFIAGEKSLYLINVANNTTQEIFAPGFVTSIFEKEGIMFIDSQTGGYHSPTYTQFYTSLCVRGETIVSTMYQREVETGK